MLEFPTQEQIAQKLAAKDQCGVVGQGRPTIAEQFQNKLQQHENDMKKLERLLALYYQSDDVREFAELLDIRLG